MTRTDTTTQMALHAAGIGFAIFLYMGLFGHGLPTELRGPFLADD
jgi:hypothetical protein